MDPVERWPSFQPLSEQEEPTAEQQAEVERFAHARTAAMLAPASPSEATEAEAHLAQAYRVVGLDPPRIRWFDSPIAFAEADKPAPQSLELLIRTTVESRVAAMMAARLSDSIWRALELQVNVIGDAAWGGVGRLIEEAVSAHFGQEDAPTRASLRRRSPRAAPGYHPATSLWVTANASIENESHAPTTIMQRMLRVHEGIQAYGNAAWFALATSGAHVLGEHELLPLARFNERVSGYRLGREEAWLVRKPVRVARDADGALHAEDGMCLRYPDGWGFYGWHDHRVPEKLILHPEDLTVEDWLGAGELGMREAIQQRIGHQRFCEMVGGLEVEKERLMVDLGRGREWTGYMLYRRADVQRVCRVPWVISQSRCREECLYIPACPNVSELSIRPEER